MNSKFYYANGYEVEPFTVPYYSVDKKATFTQNRRDRRDELDEYGWNELDRGVFPFNPLKPLKDDAITLEYRFNKHGFRGVEFPTTKTPRSIITLGCNDTIGIGMPEGLAWPTLVSNTLRYRAINLAVENTSLDTQFRLLLAWLPLIQSQYVFCLEPIDPCYEIIDEGEYRSEIYPENMREFYILNKEKNMRAMDSLCKQFGAKFAFLPREVWQYNENVDYARDLMNPGRKSHAYITYQMLKKVEYYE